MLYVEIVKLWNCGSKILRILTLTNKGFHLWNTSFLMVFPLCCLWVVFGWWVAVAIGSEKQSITHSLSPPPLDTGSCRQPLCRFQLVLKMLFPRGKQRSLLPFSLSTSLSLCLCLPPPSPCFYGWRRPDFAVQTLSISQHHPVFPPSLSFFALICALQSVDKEHSVQMGS